MTPARILFAAFALVLGAAISTGIRQQAEGDRPAIRAQIAAHEAAIHLPYADVTIEPPAGAPRVLIGMDQVMVETAHRSRPVGRSEGAREWWKAQRDVPPVVLKMDDGRFLEDERKGQLSVPLFDALLEIAETEKMLGEVSDSRDDEFRGRVVIAVDRRVPWDTLISAFYTCGQAQFGEFALLVEGGEAVEYGMNALVDEPTVTIEPERLLVSWFRGSSAVEIPCLWGCQEALDALLARMRWHYPRHHGGVIFAARDTPVSRLFAVHRQLAQDTALLRVLAHSGSDISRLVSTRELLSEGEPLHALMEAHRQTAERISVGPIRIDADQPLRWRRKLESMPVQLKLSVGSTGASQRMAPSLSANDVRACLLPALIAEPEHAGALEVTVQMTGESIYGVHASWAPVQACLSQRLVGRTLRSQAWGGLLGMSRTIDTSRATARITATIAEAP